MKEDALVVAPRYRFGNMYGSVSIRENYNIPQEPLKEDALVAAPRYRFRTQCALDLAFASRLRRRC